MSALAKADISFTFNSTADVAATANGYSASGTANLTLSFAPPPGTNLTVVKNNGIAFIDGEFSNLPNGATVNLSYNGTTYPFVAWYYGGDGNDLVLLWPYTGLVAWGRNIEGQIGDNTTTQRNLPVFVDLTGGLYKKTIVKVVSGISHTLALTTDGEVYAWGSNSFGELGDCSTIRRTTPVAVNAQSGVSVLHGKKVVSIAAGSQFSLALCSDGTVAAWGANFSGKLGDNTTIHRNAPVAVNTTNGISSLSQRKAVSIATGQHHSMALCADGTIVTWGSNIDGQLGDNTTTQRNVPTAVNTTSGVSALFGKTVVAIAGGLAHSMALCADGTLAAWGGNGWGQVGDNTLTKRIVPVFVNTTSGISALSSKAVIAIAAGNSHSMALCSDGTLVAWGANSSGQLGDATTTYRKAPVAVVRTGQSALAGKTITSISAGLEHSMALCTDGTLAAWGSNTHGQLGNNTTLQFSRPTSVGATNRRLSNISLGSDALHSLAMFAGTPEEIDVSELGPPAVSLSDDASILDYGATVAGTRTLTVSNTGVTFLTGVAARLSGPDSSEFAIVGQLPTEIAPGSSAAIKVTFLPGSFGAKNATLQIVSSDSDESSFDVSLVGSKTNTLAATLNSTSDTPLTAPQLNVEGARLDLTLNFAPQPGTNLTVARIAGTGLITGKFTNLANGDTVDLAYNGTIYRFVAWYYGEDGNDLVLLWQHTGLAAFGNNDAGQLGDNTTTQRNATVAVDRRGALAGKTIVQVSRGESHSLALTSEGKVYAWGANFAGQLGDDTTVNRWEPVAVNTSNGVSKLYDKTVVSISAGGCHSLALCSDGSVAAWGKNTYGQLGDNTYSERKVPVSVNAADGISSLFNKRVTAISAGDSYSLALCADGTVAAWGSNTEGCLGDNTTTQRPTPVAVNVANGTSALFQKTVTAIAAGQSHSLALCSDGSVAAWGSNWLGQLGDNTTTQRLAPVAVNVANGTSALFQKTVTAISVGYYHSVALCSDGTVAAWGNNDQGQLGDNSTTQRIAPVAINTESKSSALFNKRVTSIATGRRHTLALCSDGFVATWGANSYGQLGGSTTIQRNSPSAIVLSVAGSGDYSVRDYRSLSTGSQANHSFAIYSLRPPEIDVEVLEPTVKGLIDDASVIDFGTGLSESRTFRIRNSGDSFLTLGPVSIAGPDATAFSVVGQAPTAVAPGETAEFQVTMLSGSSGPKNAVLQINSNDTNESLFGIGLSGIRTNSMNATFHAATDLPMVAPALDGDGATLNLALNFAPPAGTNLTVAQITGPGFIVRPFSNLPNESKVSLSYNGTTYDFIAWYYGGDGNDLVLLGPSTGLAVWGLNFTGQLGDNTTTQRKAPVAVDQTGVLAGKTIVKAARGSSHTLVLTHDGKVYAWGRNAEGQLGDNSYAQRNVPVAVNTVSGTSALFGKTVVDIAAGSYHSLALCSDGTVAAWGSNSSGQLGDNTTTRRNVPVAVSTVGGTSTLFGKTVAAIAAGSDHSLALCPDGTVAAWGRNSSGQLGDNTTTQRNAPVAVNATKGVSALVNKTIASIAAGGAHSMALSSDGILHAWGENGWGQLGDDTTTQRNAPVKVNQTNGTSILFNRRVTNIAAGNSHSLALCSDGTLAAWGDNSSGQLGDNTSTRRNSPVAVDTTSETSFLFGKKVQNIEAGISQSYALCSDGMIAAWGDNSDGQLGDNTTNLRTAPVAVSTQSGTSILLGRTVSRLSVGAQGRHCLAIYGIAAPARITGILPTVGVTAGNTTVSIAGSNFTGATAVTIGGTAATSFTVVDNATIQAITPAHGAGLVDVVVTTPSGSATGTGIYRFGDAPSVSTPTITSTAAKTATLGGNVTSDGGAIISERGVVFSVTAANTNPAIGGIGVTKVVTSGTTGLFTAPVSGLAPGTGYTFAAYATNAFGTSYSPTSTFTTLTTLQSWRQQWYGTIDNAGNAADGQDPYQTGVSNLLVLAFFGPDQNPALVKGHQLPAAELSGGNLTYSFDEPVGGTGLTYGAEWSPTLAPGSWLTVPDAGSGTSHLFRVPIQGHERIFMRLTVSP